MTKQNDMITLQAVNVFPILDTPIKSTAVQFLPRVINGCKQLKIETIGDLLQSMNDENTDFIQAFGPQSRKDICTLLSKSNIEIEEDEMHINNLQKIIISLPIYAN